MSSTKFWRGVLVFSVAGLAVMVSLLLHSDNALGLIKGENVEEAVALSDRIQSDGPDCNGQPPAPGRCCCEYPDPYDCDQGCQYPAGHSCRAIAEANPGVAYTQDCEADGSTRCYPIAGSQCGDECAGVGSPEGEECGYCGNLVWLFPINISGWAYCDTPGNVPSEFVGKEVRLVGPHTYTATYNSDGFYEFTDVEKPEDGQSYTIIGAQFNIPRYPDFEGPDPENYQNIVSSATDKNFAYFNCNEGPPPPPPPPENEAPICRSLELDRYGNIPTSATVRAYDPPNDDDNGNLAFRLSTTGPGYSFTTSEEWETSHNNGEYTHVRSPFAGGSAPSSQGTYTVTVRIHDSQGAEPSSYVNCTKEFVIPGPPPPSPENPSCDSFTVYNTRTGEICTGDTCYAQPGDVLRLATTGTAGSWGPNGVPNVTRFSYTDGRHWNVIGGPIERGDWNYGTTVRWTVPDDTGEYMLATATGWVGPLGDGDPFNDDGRLCTKLWPDYDVWQPDGNFYINMPGETCQNDSCSKRLIIQGPGVPDLEVEKVLATPREVAVGDEVTFQLKVINTGATTLTRIPVTDRFETEFVDFVRSNITPTTVNENNGEQWGEIYWSNILAPGEVLTPQGHPGAHEKVWDVTFVATKATGGAEDKDSDNCVLVYEGTGDDDEGNHPPPDDREDCDYVIIGEVLPTDADIDIVKKLTTSDPVNVGDEVTFDLVITNIGTVRIMKYDLIDTFDSSKLDYLSATGDKLESDGTWSVVGVNVPFSVGGSRLISEDLQDIFGPLDPADKVYIHMVFEAISPGRAINTGLVNGQGENGEWVWDEDSAIVTIIGVSPPKTGASTIGLIAAITAFAGGVSAKAKIKGKKFLAVIRRKK